MKERACRGGRAEPLCRRFGGGNCGWTLGLGCRFLTCKGKSLLDCCLFLSRGDKWAQSRALLQLHMQVYKCTAWGMVCLLPFIFGLARDRQVWMQQCLEQCQASCLLTQLPHVPLSSWIFFWPAVHTEFLSLLSLLCLDKWAGLFLIDYFVCVWRFFFLAYAKWIKALWGSQWDNLWQSCSSLMFLGAMSRQTLVAVTWLSVAPYTLNYTSTAPLLWRHEIIQHLQWTPSCRNILWNSCVHCVDQCQWKRKVCHGQSVAGSSLMKLSFENKWEGCHFGLLLWGYAFI